MWPPGMTAHNHQSARRSWRRHRAAEQQRSAQRRGAVTPGMNARGAKIRAQKRATRKATECICEISIDPPTDTSRLGEIAGGDNFAGIIVVETSSAGDSESTRV